MVVLFLRDPCCCCSDNPTSTVGSFRSFSCLCCMHRCHRCFRLVMQLENRVPESRRNDTTAFLFSVDMCNFPNTHQFQQQRLGRYTSHSRVSSTSKIYGVFNVIYQALIILSSGFVRYRDNHVCRNHLGRALKCIRTPRFLLMDMGKANPSLFPTREMYKKKNSYLAL